MLIQLMQLEKSNSSSDTNSKNKPNQYKNLSFLQFPASVNKKFPKKLKNLT